jgi:hypothetical protein
VVEVITKDEIVTIYGLFGREAEGDAVLVARFGVLREGEVRGCGWGGAREATVVLGGCVSVKN